MRAETKRPATPEAGRAGRKTKNTFLKNHAHVNKISEKVNHPSRCPEQTQSDAEILANFGLRFQPVAGHFHTLMNIETPQTDSQKIKEWAVGKLMERLYEGKNTTEHRHAARFWMRDGLG